MKAGVVQSLASAEQTSRHTCAQVIAKIARIEFPAGEWNELIPGAQQRDQGGLAADPRPGLLSLGYFCEEIDSDDVQQSSVNEILTAIVDGMKPAKSPEVVHAACTAMLNALEFVHTNFGNKPERDHIMNAIC